MINIKLNENLITIYHEPGTTFYPGSNILEKKKTYDIVHKRNEYGRKKDTLRTTGRLIDWGKSSGQADYLKFDTSQKFWSDSCIILIEDILEIKEHVIE